MAYISAQRFHAQQASSTSLSLTVNVPATCNRVVVLAARGYINDTNPVLTGGTLGGQALTLVANASATTNGLGGGLLSMTAPPTGSQTLALTWDLVLSRYDVIVMYFTDAVGVALTGATGIATFTGANSPTRTVTSASGSTVYGVLLLRGSSASDPAATAGTGETIIASLGTETAWGGRGTAYVLSEAGASSVTLNPSATNTDEYLFFGWSLAASGSGGATLAAAGDTSLVAKVGITSSVSNGVVLLEETGAAASVVQFSTTSAPGYYMSYALASFALSSTLGGARTATSTAVLRKGRTLTVGANALLSSAPALLNVASGTFSGTSLTYTQATTVPTGSNQVAWLCWMDFSTGATGITLGGQTMTKLTAAQGAPEGNVTIWMLKNPPTGAQNLVATYATSVSRTGKYALVVTNNTNQTQPFIDFRETQLDAAGTWPRTLTHTHIGANATDIVIGFAGADVTATGTEVNVQGLSGLSQSGSLDGQAGYAELRWGSRGINAPLTASATFAGTIGGTRYVELVSFVVRGSSTENLADAGRLLLTVLGDTSSTDQVPTVLVGTNKYMTRSNTNIQGTSALYGLTLRNPPQAGAAAVYSQDFDALVSDLTSSGLTHTVAGSPNAPGAGSAITLDATRSFNGTKSLRHSFAVMSAGCTNPRMESTYTLSGSPTQVWVEAWVHFDTGFATDFGQTSCPPEFQLLKLLPNTGNTRHVLSVGVGGNQVQTTCRGESTSAYSEQRSFTDIGFNPFTDNQWHRVRFYGRLVPGTTQLRVATWLDDTLIHDSGLVSDPSNMLSTSFATVVFGSTLNQNNTSAIALNFDGIRVYTSDPGWSGGGSTTITWSGLTAGAKQLLTTMLHNVQQNIPVLRTHAVSSASVTGAFTTTVPSATNSTILAVVRTTHTSDPLLTPAAGNTLVWTAYDGGTSVKVLQVTGTGNTVTVGGTFSGHSTSAPFQMLIWEFQPATLHVAASGLLRYIGIRTVGASAFLYGARIRTVAASGVLRRLQSRTTAASATLTTVAQGQVRGAVGSAVLRKSLTKTTSASAVKGAVVTPRTRTASASAVLTAAQRLRACTVNAVLVRLNAAPVTTFSMFRAEETRR